jgi:hypothetical protein
MKIKSRPILFSTQMVKSILEDKKTITRRIIKEKPDYFINCVEGKPLSIGLSGSCSFFGAVINGEDKTIICPYGKVGDVLWVRETWWKAPNNCSYTALYKADFPMVYYGTEWDPNEKVVLEAKDYKFKPSIHMPKDYARIFLKITNIRVERLKDISEEDAIAEGIENFYDNTTIGATAYRNYTVTKKDIKESPWNIVANDAVESFQTLWQSINGSDSWKENPFVWVIEFEKTEKPKNFY